MKRLWERIIIPFQFIFALGIAVYVLLALGIGGSDGSTD